MSAISKLLLLVVAAIFVVADVHDWKGYFRVKTPLDGYFHSRPYMATCVSTRPVVVPSDLSAFLAGWPDEYHGGKNPVCEEQ